MLVSDFDFSSVRIAGTKERPLYCVKDICTVIGIKNAGDKTKILPKSERHMIRTAHSARLVLFTTEEGKARIVSSCRTPTVVSNTGEGFIYLLLNTNGDVAKVGRAINCRKRWNSYQCPVNWKHIAAIRVKDMICCERIFINWMKERYPVACKREFFWCDNVKPIVKYLEENFGPNVIQEI